ncbi:FtsW/RodA/SpoVE family cell cycle protein [Streptomyces kaniharaensis]|uniref:FtsW/RodA/SpoVE family cell cycle protein n=1 Tax=Streptomyces kaniharaensis TaxID=212423 RepID=A0A6N7KJL6_9ACTN|nr:FtsW/RodA/SpoVE family cell cycle protein [Streptomyces kaniharaensis]MQS11700.1 FtsW/RodA/SpoVE family cell cycle protein [Streptomyces kaniharaensis]
MQSTARGEGRRLAGRHRNIELGLLVLAVAICLAGHIDADLALTGKMPPGLLVHGLSLGALAGAAHMAVRRFAPYADPLILPLGVFLTGFGLMLLDRLDISYAAAHSRKGDYQKIPAAPQQLMWVYIAVVVSLVAVVVLIKHHRFLQRYVYLLMAGALILLAAPAFFPGRPEDFGAKRWIRLFGLSFEPDEFVKVAITIFFAGYLMASRDALALAGRKIWGLTLPRGRHAGPVLAIWVVSLLVLVFERDLGTSLIFFGVFVVMLYVATERTSWVVLGLLMAVGGAAVVGTVEPHVHGRVEAWLHPLDIYKEHHDPAIISDQPAEALFSLGTGHLTGTGLGSGRPWLIGFAGRSDFVFTTIGEELGLAGVTAILLVYLLLVQRGLRTAVGLTDPFGKLLATGLSTALALQVFVVVGGVSGLVPLTGKALPFLAAGGSSLLANWLTVALLIKLSDSAGRTALEPALPSTDFAAPAPASKRAAARQAGRQAPSAGQPAGHPSPESQPQPQSAEQQMPGYPSAPHPAAAPEASGRPHTPPFPSGPYPPNQNPATA